MTASIAIGLPLGGAIGLAYIALLRWNVGLYVAGRRSPAIALHVARLGAITIALGIAAHVGAAALLALTIGFTAARLPAVRSHPTEEAR